MKDQSRGLFQGVTVGHLMNTLVVLAIIAVLVVIIVPVWRPYEPSAIRDVLPQGRYSMPQVQQIYLIQLFVPEEFEGQIAVENRNGRVYLNFSEKSSQPEILVEPRHQLDLGETIEF